MKVQRRCDWHWICLAAVLISGLTVIALVFWDRTAHLEIAQRRASQPVGELLASNTVGQSFYSPANGLYKLDLVFGTYGHPGASDIILHLKKSPRAANDLATVRVNSQDVQDNKYHSFSFPRQRDIAGRTLYFYLEAPQASPGRAVTAYRSDEDVYRGGQAYYDGIAASNDLAFVAYYHLGPLDAVRFVTHQLSSQRPCLLGNPLFYVLLIILHFVLVGKLFIVLREGDVQPGIEE